MQHKNHHNGFTLLEMSIVLLILSLMLGGVLSALAQDSRRKQTELLKVKMDAIEQAILNYTKRAVTYTLPCPAPFVAFTDSGFGTADAPECPNLNYQGGYFSLGAVPVRTLGLADDYAFDPWGNLFTYAVSIKSTLTNALSTNNPSIDMGFIDLTDTGGNTLPNKAVLVLVSHGPNGFGAYNREGTIRSGYGTSANEQINCNCDSDGGAAKEPVNKYVVGFNTLNREESDGGFDDIVRYYGREFFLLSTDIITEKP